MRNRSRGCGSDQEERVEELTLTVPDLWADHHILKVRDALADLDGLESIEASAKDRTLTLLIDPSRLDAARVTDHLVAAGYPPGVHFTRKVSIEKYFCMGW
jgi:copper chaperone CopZ